MSVLTRHLPLCLSLAWGLLLAPCAHASEPLPEYTIKAGYLYNFAILTEWPSSALNDNLELCFVGDDDLGSALESLQGKMVNYRPINIRSLTHPGEVTGCNILFIGKMGHTEFALLQREIAGQPILTVTDNENLAKSGLTVFLRPERQRLVFEINTNAAKRANLNISSRLLRLARGGAGE
jgi:hypothetical protein